MAAGVFIGSCGGILSFSRIIFQVVPSLFQDDFRRIEMSTGSSITQYVKQENIIKVAWRRAVHRCGPEVREREDPAEELAQD